MKFSKYMCIHVNYLQAKNKCLEINRSLKTYYFQKHFEFFFGQYVFFIFYDILLSLGRDGHVMIDAVEEDEWVSELKVARLNTSFNAGFIAAKEKLDSTSQMWSHVAESKLGHHCRSLR